MRGSLQHLCRRESRRYQRWATRRGIYHLVFIEMGRVRNLIYIHSHYSNLCRYDIHHCTWKPENAVTDENQHRLFFDLEAEGIEKKIVISRCQDYQEVLLSDVRDAGPWEDDPS
jgi:hypothetical protein